MKLITRYKNTLNNISYNLYQLDSGVKLIFLRNPTTVDFDIALIHKAGSIYETIENVPNGTAHMLEHILFRPQGQFKTIEEISQFESGTKQYPCLYINGETSNKYLELIGHTHQAGTLRLLERLESIAIFEKSKLIKNYDTEKGIVLAERSRDVTTEKDKVLQFIKYLEEDVFPEFTHPIGGEFEDIKKIDIDDLEKYFNRRFTKENLTVAIQAQRLDKKVVIQLEKLTQKYPNNPSKQLKVREFQNKLKYGSFIDERVTGTSLYLSYFQKEPIKGFDYKADALNSLLRKLIKKVGDQSLREEQGLIYDTGVGTLTSSTINYTITMLELIVEDNKLVNLLQAYDNFFYQELEAFLMSEKGDRWFQSLLSSLLYPPTEKFDEELARGSSILYIENGNLYNLNTYREAVKKIKKEELLDQLKIMQRIPTHIWVETKSKKEQSKVEKIVKASKFWKRFE